MHIRTAGQNDRDALVALMGRFYSETAFPFASVRAARAFDALLRDPTLGKAWLIEREGSPVGYAALTFGFSLEHGGRIAFLDDLFVREEHRGLGLGRAAIEAALVECRRLEIQAVLLEIAPDNAAAKRLYRRAGFAPRGLDLMILRSEGQEGTEEP